MEIFSLKVCETLENKNSQRPVREIIEFIQNIKNWLSIKTNKNILVFNKWKALKKEIKVTHLSDPLLWRPIFKNTLNSKSTDRLTHNVQASIVLLYHSGKEKPDNTQLQRKLT